ncbi:hypothetical protein BGZ83_002408 [Gryganskiella cystojenkinii]|nr:hypothetical protein BGZ83_002408 [Gryganskiella cystojenkinii]
MLPSGSGPDSDSDLSSEQSQDAHSGVIMALPGPGLNASMGSLAAGTGSGGAGARVSSPMNGRSSNRGGQESAMLGWNRFNNSMSTLVSQSLVSRLSTHRPQFSSIGSSNWSVVRVMNTCHLLYLVPVTTITVGRLLTTETICDEQLFSWLTVQAFLFMSQIICACYILQRQTMSTRVTILDQRARVLLLVFMIWTVIGVGFLGADGRSGSNSNNNSNNQGPSCSPAEDPIYSLSFKIIVFHISLIGFYFLPCSSFLLSRVLPSSIASGLTRTATKPMIDKLGSMPMTDGLFGADPEEAQCAICLGEYSVDETIRFLPCQHHFHQECVDQWLLTDKSCPLCKHDIDKPLEAERAALVNSRIFHYHQQQQQQQQQNQQSQVAAGSNSGRNDPEALTMYPNGFQIIVI